ncbi:fimbrial protein, partial [Buttiauxella brennerae]|uniref:fimbrial protein n=1 Tax=Buttiauxella brennerae TaxID=82988 RepID=UPI00286F34E5
LLILAAVASMANAEDAKINISGTITDPPCTFDAGGGTNLSINLGNDIQAQRLATKGQGSDWVPFTIKFVDCPRNKSKVEIKFSGTPDDYNPAYLYASTGTAKNVAVELRENSGGSYDAGFGNGQSVSQVPIDADHSVNYNLKARVTATGAATAGSVASVVLITLIYN